LPSGEPLQKLGYDVAKDFEPVSLVATLPFVLFASPVLPAIPWSSFSLTPARIPAS